LIAPHHLIWLVLIPNILDTPFRELHREKVLRNLEPRFRFAVPIQVDRSRCSLRKLWIDSRGDLFPVSSSSSSSSDKQRSPRFCPLAFLGDGLGSFLARF
jgi:hypothetical protein